MSHPAQRPQAAARPAARTRSRSARPVPADRRGSPSPHPASPGSKPAARARSASCRRGSRPGRARPDQGRAPPPRRQDARPPDVPEHGRRCRPSVRPARTAGRGQFHRRLAGRVLQLDRMAVEQPQTWLAQQRQRVGQRTSDVRLDRANLMRLHDAGDAHPPTADLQARPRCLRLLTAQPLSAAGDDDLQCVGIHDAQLRPRRCRSAAPAAASTPAAPRRRACRWRGSARATKDPATPPARARNDHCAPCRPGCWPGSSSRASPPMPSGHSRPRSAKSA